MKPLGRQFGRELGDAGYVAAGTRDVGDEAEPDRIADGPQNDRDGRGGALGRLGRGSAERDDHVDLEVDQLGRVASDAIHLRLRIAHLVNRVLSLDVAEPRQGLAQDRFRPAAAQDADAESSFRLLGAQRQGPRERACG
jgi:hypothetical protein